MTKKPVTTNTEKELVPKKEKKTVKKYKILAQFVGVRPDGEQITYLKGLTYTDKDLSYLNIESLLNRKLIKELV